MPISIDEFRDRLAASKLLSADDADSMLASVVESERPTDGESLATLLVQSGKLTSFQARCLCEGKADTLILGNYVLLDRIGRGGMGDVFKAEHRRMKRVVALKVVKPEILDSPSTLKRFQREVETVAKLDHPNVVTAHDADEAQGINFLVMQFVDGRDLSSLVKANGPFPVAKAVECMLQAARGLSYAHEEGIVHRDVKPGNMLLDKKGVLKILDLGLATLTGTAARGNESLTGSGMIVGTLDYMAPEQAHSPKLADHRSDIYSLGMTLWYLLTGRAAYETESVVEKLLAHREQPIPSLLASGQPSSASGQCELAEAAVRDLDTIFHKLVAKRPADRYQSMDEAIAALEAFQQIHKELLTPPKLGSTDATVQWDRRSEGESPTPRRGGAEEKSAAVVEALVDEPGSAPNVDQTASLLSPHSDTTATLRKPIAITARALIGMGDRLILSIALVAAVLLLLSASSWFYSNVLRGRKPSESAVAHGNSSATTDSASRAPAPNPKSEIPYPQSAAAPGFALEFNGKGSYVDLPTLRYDGSHPITLEAMIVTHPTKARGMVIGDWGMGGIRLAFPSGAQPPRGLFIVTDTVGERTTLTQEALPIKQPLHVAGVLRGSTAQLFVNGKPQQGFELKAAYKAGTSPFRIGARATENPGPAQSLFSGLIDEVRISRIARYTTDFTPATRFEPDADTLALYHFDEGSSDILTDASGNNHPGKIVNAKWVLGIAGGPPAAK